MKSVEGKKDVVQYIHYKSLKILLQQSETIKRLKNKYSFPAKSCLNLFISYMTFPSWFAEN
jgi:hypothetical protein